MSLEDLSTYFLVFPILELFVRERLRKVQGEIITPTYNVAIESLTASVISIPTSLSESLPIRG